MSELGKIEIMVGDIYSEGDSITLQSTCFFKSKYFAIARAYYQPEGKYSITHLLTGRKLIQLNNLSIAKRIIKKIESLPFAQELFDCGDFKKIRRKRMKVKTVMDLIEGEL